LTECRNKNSVLVDINNNEENVYIQHRHNGEKSWLGLNDISAEGTFTWVDRGAGNFTVWAKNQPNNFNEEDCVHALGVKYNYEWNDVKCSDCHQFTCKKGVTVDSLEMDLNAAIHYLSPAPRSRERVAVAAIFTLLIQMAREDWHHFQRTVKCVERMELV